MEDREDKYISLLNQLKKIHKKITQEIFTMFIVFLLIFFGNTIMFFNYKYQAEQKINLVNNKVVQIQQENQNLKVKVAFLEKQIKKVEELSKKIDNYFALEKEILKEKIQIDLKKLESLGYNERQIHKIQSMLR